MLKNSIIHILRGQVYHTTPTVVESILKNAERVSEKTKNNHFFILIFFDSSMQYNNNNKINNTIYLKLFEKYNTSNYKFITNTTVFYRELLFISLTNKVIFHENIPLKQSLVINTLLLIFKRKLLNRTSLVCWGANDFETKSLGIRHCVIDFVRKKVYKRYKYIVLLSIGDKQLYEKLYPNFSNGVFLPYLNPQKRELVIKDKASNRVKVMVSHSGWEHNNHIDSFKLLSKFSKYIDVVCPLCYGDTEYINKIIKEGKKYFGLNFSYFQSLIPKDEYLDYLKQFDVFITSANCQTGLGNIYMSMCGGAKIFVRGNLYSSLSNNGFEIFYTEDLIDMDYDTFRKPLEIEIAKKNVDVCNNLTYEDLEILSKWKEVYEY